MKKNLPTRLLTMLSALLAVLCLTTYTAATQGFVKSYPLGQVVNQRVDVTPEGYCLTGMKTPPSGGADLSFFRLNTDSGGTQTALDINAFELPRYVLSAPTSCGQLVLSDLEQLVVNNSAMITRVDADGTLFWRDTLAQVFPGQSNNTIPCATSDGNILLVGSTNAFLQKLDPDGNLLFTVVPPNAIPGSSGAFFTSPEPTPDGGALVNAQGVVGNDLKNHLVKIAADCSVDWSVLIPNSDEGMTSASTAPDGNHLVLAPSAVTGNQEFNLLKFSPGGSVLWEVSLTNLIGPSLRKVNFVLATQDNGAIVCGQSVPAPGTSSRTIMARFDASGGLMWKKIFTNQPTFFANQGIALPDGNFVFTGVNLAGGSVLMLWKIGPNGQILPNALSGTLVLDANSDCIADPTESPLANWIVTANALGTDYYATTDTGGHFHIPDLPGGPSYFIDLTVNPPSYAWLPCPPPALFMPADTTDFTLHTEVAAGKLLDCPVMTVDLGMPPMRRCASRTFSVNYCNTGTLPASKVSIEVYLPDEIVFESATTPFSITGQTVSFGLGNVPMGDCGTFQFKGFVSCDSLLLGQTLCVEAHIFPDTFCINPNEWSGARLEADALCLGDTVHFSLKNTGTAPTTQQLEYLVIDDDVVMRQGAIPSGFPVNAVHDVFLPATGATLRFVAEQEPQHPLPGYPSVAMEGCGGWSLGFVTPFLNMTGNPFSDLECREVVGSYDPNEKQAYPQGVHSEHFIEPGTPLTYVLNFQNTGTDTAFQVVLRDTLSQWLDPTTVRPGASSHPYRWNLTGKGELVFRFDPIALPDSNANVEASQGFVQFAIQMRPDVPLGTVIENRVGIYFDQNPVVLTNTVRHTVDTGFLKIDLSPVRDLRSLPLLSVRPNPAADAVYITLSEGLGGSQTLLLSDAFGKTVLRKTFSGGTAELHRGELPAGIYFAKLVENERVVAVGKVVWR